MYDDWSNVRRVVFRCKAIGVTIATRGVLRSGAINSAKSINGGLQGFAGLGQTCKTSEFDAAVAAEVGIVDDFEHLVVVKGHAIVMIIPDSVFNINAFGEGEEFLDATVGVITFALFDAEVAKVGQGTATGMVDLFYHFHQPVGIAGETTVVFNYDIEVHRRTEFGKSGQTIGGEFDLFFPSPGASCVHPDGMAAKVLRSMKPFFVILYGLTAAGVVRITDIAFTVAHDKKGFYSQIAGPSFHFVEVALVQGLIHEELVYVFDGMNAVIFGHFGKVEVVDFASTDLFIDCPLSQGDLKAWFLFLGGGDLIGDQSQSCDG